MDTLMGEPIVEMGTPEESWERSEFLSALPTTTIDVLLQGCNRLVIVSPHPDDEVLGCGGLLSVCAARQMDVLVVSISDGENCYPDNLEWPPQRVRQARRRELDQALQALGIPAPKPMRLEIPDGKVAAHESQISRTLETLLASDDAVLVPWRRDGHPDHEAAARAACHAAARTGAKLIEFPIWAWHWVSADGGAFHGLCMSRLDLGPQTHEAKLQAIACFSSQVVTTDPSIPAPALPAHVLKRFARAYEVFIHA